VAIVDYVVARLGVNPYYSLHRTSSARTRPSRQAGNTLKKRAKQPEIGKLIDHAMDLIEIDNPSLRAVLPKTYARPSLDVRRLGETERGVDHRRHTVDCGFGCCGGIHRGLLLAVGEVAGGHWSSPGTVICAQLASWRGRAEPANPVRIGSREAGTDSTYRVSTTTDSIATSLLSTLGHDSSAHLSSQIGQRPAHCHSTKDVVAKR
jgi:hypothetical protein